jgi:hypothetical protein
MTQKEYKKLIDTLDVWVKECETFYNSFKDVFKQRADAVEELIYRCLQVVAISEYLFSAQFISTEKYLEIADKLEKIGLTTEQRKYFVEKIKKRN